MATIRENVELVLKHLGIPGVVPFDESQPDRIFAWDTQHALLDACFFDTKHWFSGSGANHSLSGIVDTVRITFREHATPSMQVTIQKRIPTSDAPYRYFCEIDVDFHAPDNPVSLAGHAEEVLHNKMTGDKTDQQEVALRLAARFAKENDGKPVDRVA